MGGLQVGHQRHALAGSGRRLRAHQVSAGVVLSKKTVAEHVTETIAFEKELLDREEIAAGTFSQHRHKWTLFGQDYGHLRIAEIRESHVAAWMKAQALTESATFNNYRKILRVLFTYAIEAKLRPDNPVASIKKRKERKKPVGILTVGQTAQLLHTAVNFVDATGRARYRIALRRLVLEIFAGVRFGSAQRLTQADVNQDDRGILHPAKSIKTDRRQYVDGFPKVLWLWLKIAPDDSELTERQYLRLKSELFHDAKVPHPHNCLRHSFCTYHLASRKNPGLTATLLCHRNQEQLWDDYNGNAPAADGRRWEGVTPENANGVAEEWRQQLAQQSPAQPLGENCR